MYCIKLFLLLFIITIPFFSYGQKNKDNDSAAKVNWLKANAIQIRSADSTDDNFSDLMPLKKIIGNAKVVMLGEQTHVDGATYLAKTRFVRFLHKEMGFNTIAFESGFYDVARSWQNIKKGMSVNDAFKESVYFDEFREYQPLIQYIQRHVRSGTPLEMVGFDHNVTKQPGRDSLLNDLRSRFNDLGIVTPHLADTASFARQLINLVHYKSPDKFFFDTLNKLTQIVDSVTGRTNKPDHKFLLQLLKSIKKAGETNIINNAGEHLSGDDKMRAGLFAINIRDAQMADNLLWYTTFYPGKKIIVWAANFHIAAEDLLKTDKEYQKYNKRKERDSLQLVNVKPMGAYVKEKLRDKVYTVAYTTYKGSFGVTWRDGKSYAVPIAGNQRPELELEELLNATGFDFAFVDLKKPARGGQWLRKTIVTRPFGNNAVKGEWHKAVDGIFYIKELFGVTEIK